MIDERGILLVYPLANQARPPSIWSELWPKTKMRWDWDQGADTRVVDLWHLKNVLAAKADVAYAKWFRDRATFFSLPVFHALLGEVASEQGLGNEARDILALLRERSPLSTKQIRAEAGLQGKATQGAFDRAMKQLWRRLLIVGIGEVADGAFPSLLVSATDHVFEDLWATRAKVPPKARAALADAFAYEPKWKEFASKLEVKAPRARKSRDADDRERGPGISMRDEIGPKKRG